MVEKFDLNRFIRSSSYGVIEELHISFDSLHDDYPEESSITGKQVLEMLDSMPSLRDLRLDSTCNIVFPDMDLHSVDRAVPIGASLGNVIHRESGKCRIILNQCFWHGQSSARIQK